MVTFHPTGTALLLLASSLFAQSAEFRRQSPPLSHPDLDAYCQSLGQRLLPGSKIPLEVIQSSSAEPVPLRGGPIFIPTSLFRNARSEAEFAADRRALQFAESAGFPPAALGEYLRRPPTFHREPSAKLE